MLVHELGMWEPQWKAWEGIRPRERAKRTWAGALGDPRRDEQEEELDRQRAGAAGQLDREGGGPLEAGGRWAGLGRGLAGEWDKGHGSVTGACG